MGKTADVDQLNSSERSLVMRLAYGLIDTAQDHRADVQINSVALLYVLICERFGVNVRTELERAEKIIADLTRENLGEIRALKQYIKEEL